MGKDIKVRYVKDRVEVTMPLDGYTKMCRHFNVLNSALNDFGDTMDFRLSELNSIDELRYAMMHNLGFKRVHEGHYSDYRIPTKGGK